MGRRRFVQGLRFDASVLAEGRVLAVIPLAKVAFDAPDLLSGGRFADLLTQAAVAGVVSFALALGYASVAALLARPPAS
jgi:hypothetical protein